jgi:hypothetical protein
LGNQVLQADRKVSRVERNILVHIGGSSDSFRTESFNDVEYLVVPLVMLVEGVIQGANASQPEFCPNSELEKSAVGWNGRPIVMNHPMIQGSYVSANSPTVLENWAFGFVFNTTTPDRKLQAEAWIDTTRAAEKGGEFQDVVDRLNAGEIIEVSTGLYTEVKPSKGKFNNKRYSSIWSTIIPDHLAILSSGVTGACSVEDGCGIPRLNHLLTNAAASTGDKYPLNTQALRVHAEPVIQTHCSCGGSATAVPVTLTPASTSSIEQPEVHTSGPVGGSSWVPTPIDGGRVGGGESLAAVTSLGPLLDASGGTGTGATVPLGVDDNSDAGEDWAMVSGDQNAWLSSVRPSRPADTSFSTMAKRALTQYGRDVADAIHRNSNKVTLRGNAIDPSVTTSDAMQIVAQAFADTYDVGYAYLAAMTTDVVVMCCYDDDWDMTNWQVNYSVDGDGAVTFSGEPTPVIIMTRIVARPNATSGEPDMNTRTPPAAVAAATTPAAVEPTVNAATATVVESATAAAPTVLTAEQYVQNAPPEIREMMNQSLRLFTEHKASVIAAIKANSRNKFTDVQLQAMDIEVLEGMADLAYDPPGIESATPMTRPDMTVAPAPAVQAAAPLSYAGRAAPTGEPPAVQEQQQGAPQPPKVFAERPQSRYGRNLSAVAAVIN